MSPVIAVQHTEWGPMWAERLRPFAQDLAVRYGAQVVLLGSAMHQQVPRDVDVRALIIDADRFERRFGQRPEDWRWDRGFKWQREADKMQRRMEQLLPTGVGADFSIWPIDVFQDAVPHVILAEGWVDVYPQPTLDQLREECLNRAAALRRPNPPAGTVDAMNREATFFEAVAEELLRSERATHQ